MTSISRDGVVSANKLRYRKAIAELKKRREVRKPLGELVNRDSQQQQDASTVDSSEDEADFKPAKKRRFIRKLAAPVESSDEADEVTQPKSTVSTRASPPSGKVAWLVAAVSDMSDQSEDDAFKDQSSKHGRRASPSKKKRNRAKEYKRARQPVSFQHNGENNYDFDDGMSKSYDSLDGFIVSDDDVCISEASESESKVSEMEASDGKASDNTASDNEASDGEASNTNSDNDASDSDVADNMASEIDAAFLALESGNESHIPGRFDIEFQSVDEVVNLFRSAEETAANGRKILIRPVHQLLDPDIMFFKVFRERQYKSTKWSQIKRNWKLEAIERFNELQGWRQAFLFHHLYHKGCYTASELEQKIIPYISGYECLIDIFSKTMANDGQKWFRTYKSKMRAKAKKIASVFVRSCIEQKESHLEWRCRYTGGDEIDAFISSVKHWSSEDSDAISPFVESLGPSLPRVPFIAKNPKLTVTTKNRKDHQLRTMQRYDRYTVSQRAAFHHAVSYGSTLAVQLAMLWTYGCIRMQFILTAFIDMLSGKKITINTIMRMDNNVTMLALHRIIMLPLDVKLRDVKVESIFDSDTDWNKLLAIRKSLIDRAYGSGTVFGPLKSIKVPSLFTLWGSKARAMLQRQNQSLVFDTAERDTLASHMQHDHETSNGKCKMCGVQMLTGEGRSGASVSIDRIIPGCRGGRYVISNMQLICLACNFNKNWHTLDQAYRLLYELSRITWTIGQDGFLNTPVKSDDLRPIESAEEQMLVDRWIRYYTRSYAIRKTKTVRYKLSRVDLRRLVQKSYVGNGEVQDVTGFRGPIFLFSIDRIDSSLGYEKGNVRLLLLGLNMLKGTEPSDRLIISYLEHLKSVKKVLSKKIKDDVDLPLHKTAAKILGRAPNATDEQDELEACLEAHNERYDENHVIRTRLL